MENQVSRLFSADGQ